MLSLAVLVPPRARADGTNGVNDIVTNGQASQVMMHNYILFTTQSVPLLLCYRVFHWMVRMSFREKVIHSFGIIFRSAQIDQMLIKEAYTNNAIPESFIQEFFCDSY